MQAIFWTVEEVAEKAQQFYNREIRQEVEHEDNLGKMIVIDAESEYEIDETGVESILSLKQKKTSARLFMMRIGYDAAFGFGGTAEQISSRDRF